jgi:hypothetical protein
MRVRSDLPYLDGNHLLFESHLLEKNSNFVSIRCGPIVNVNHYNFLYLR